MNPHPFFMSTGFSLPQFNSWPREPCATKCCLETLALRNIGGPTNHRFGTPAVLKRPGSWRTYLLFGPKSGTLKHKNKLFHNVAVYPLNKTSSEASLKCGGSQVWRSQIDIHVWTGHSLFGPGCLGPCTVKLPATAEKSPPRPNRPRQSQAGWGRCSHFCDISFWWMKPDKLGACIPCGTIWVRLL